MYQAVVRRTASLRSNAGCVVVRPHGSVDYKLVSDRADNMSDERRTRCTYRSATNNK